MENKVCKNKNCMKPLPEGYKHKYCEACRNRQAQKVKNGFKTAAGIVGTVAGAVMACKATTKVSEIVEDTKEQLDTIHKVAEAGEMKTNEGVIPYTEEDAKKDTTIVYAQTAVKFVKLYGPAIAVGTLSIASILAGHNILRKRSNTPAGVGER